MERILGGLIPERNDRFEVMLGEVESLNPRTEAREWQHVPGRTGRTGRTGNGDTARRTEPGNRAHAFRMTLVAQGKLPQITDGLLIIDSCLLLITAY